MAGTRLASMRGTMDYSLPVSSQPAVLQNNKMLVTLAFIVVIERHCCPFRLLPAALYIPCISCVYFIYTTIYIFSGLPAIAKGRPPTTMLVCGQQQQVGLEN